MKFAPMQCFTLAAMKHLKELNQYFWKYRFRFFAGIFFVVASNYFAILAPQLTGYVVNQVQALLPGAKSFVKKYPNNWLIDAIIQQIEQFNLSFSGLVALCSLIILLLAISRGVLMFFMRQTIIVMSRYIEFDQKNAIYKHYQQLDTAFMRSNNTGDLMNRIAEDVSRVRMYTGPAIMYLINLIALISFCVMSMVKKDATLALYVLAPLPLLAITIYFVNTIINQKSERIQEALSDLTTIAQESYSGIRVIKSFIQEKAMLGFFKKNSENYRKQAVSLAKVEAIYFPSMALMIGLSTIITVMIGGLQALNDPSKVGIVVEFVLYINMLTFPVSAIGWVASMIQRASASQKRINQFLLLKPSIQNHPDAIQSKLSGNILFDKVNFTYPHTGIHALKNFSLKINAGDKVLILGKTGSGKTTIFQLLMRFFEPQSGSILLDGNPITKYHLSSLRSQISYVPQDVFLFSDTIANNIKFGLDAEADHSEIEKAAKLASIHNEILQFSDGYATLIGERGVTLSGGQKQRISIARALIKSPEIILFDDCLSAVDAKTEQQIIGHLYEELKSKTALIISHRIFSSFQFSKIIVLEDGELIEEGTHEELMALNGSYAQLYHQQTTVSEAVDTNLKKN